MKNDFLQECMSSGENIPLDQFQLAWCRVCANRQCARSSLNNSSFDQRVATWKDRLFDNVKRANDEDPNFNTIRSKRFLPIQPQFAQPGNTPSFVTSQIVPEHFDVDSVVKTHMESIKPSTDTEKPEVVSEEPKPTMVESVSEPEQKFEQVSVPTVPENTPFQQGSMLPNGPEGTSPDVFINPGGSYTFGSDK